MFAFERMPQNLETLPTTKKKYFIFFLSMKILKVLVAPR